MSFGNIWRRNIAFLRLAIVSNLEYRVNFAVDTLIQPLLAALIEVALWFAVFSSIQRETLAGFARADYILYAIWAGFLARVASNWVYEHRMIEEIDTGSINALLTRPVPFFEMYWSQFIGYKLLTLLFSLPIPLVSHWWIRGTLPWKAVAAALGLLFCYLFFLHCVSFIVATLAFFLNRVYSLTATKNVLFWLLSGELFPLDLAPEPVRSLLIALPFSGGVYTPVALITGRVSYEAVLPTLLSIGGGIAVTALIGCVLWQQGVRRYAGTGA